MTSSHAGTPLGVRIGETGGTLGVWSENASSVELCIFDDKDPNWVVDQVALVRDDDAIWSGGSALLVPGARYAIRVDGPKAPRNAFNPHSLLLEPYSRGVVRPSNE
jgi:glycogen debranching enzyme